MTLFEKNPWVRTVYLYLFSLVGLALVVIGVVRLLDLGLKILIFKEADKPESVQQAPPYPYGFLKSPPGSRDEISTEQVTAQSEKVTKDVTARRGGASEGMDMTEEEKVALKRWLVDYKEWQDTGAKIDYLRSRREREASNALAFMAVGLPLYLYHWLVIKRDRAREQV